MWHGMPFKKVGGDRVAASHTLATSKMWVSPLASAFQVAPETVLAIGLPRNDRLIGRGEGRVNELFRRRQGPLVVWLPTFRRTIFNDSGHDGLDFDNPFNLPGATVESVEAAANELDINLIVKTHPYTRRQSWKGTGLQILDTTELHASGITLYQLLSAADLLITDFSSVWIDFLLTRKPQIFAIGDAEDYSATRGFTFPDSLSRLPGPICTTFRDVRDALETTLIEERRPRPDIIRSLTDNHTFTDGNSGRRLLETVLLT